MANKIFIDGEAGTTGLEIRARLKGRDDLELLTLADDVRKDAGARRDALNAADISILCLPDDAARDAVAMIENADARVIDASVAHRTHADWAYGMPELQPGQGETIAAAARVSNPGCYALTSIALLRPLIAAAILPADHPVSLNAISGYSGGGRKLIERFEGGGGADRIDSAFYLYGFDLEHKHIEEIRVHGGLRARPLLVPSVGRFRQGMVVSLPLHLWALPGEPKPADILAALGDYYAGARFISVVAAEPGDTPGRLDPEALNGTNGLRIHVFGNPARGQVLLAAVLDNLGKGASGQAVQNLNLMLGLDEATGLT